VRPFVGEIVENDVAVDMENWLNLKVQEKIVQVIDDLKKLRLLLKIL
jgi:hypothetical protein